MQDVALCGLDASEFTLRETGSDSGVFTGTFAVPANHCPSGDASGNAVTVTGTDISANMWTSGTTPAQS